MADVLPRLDNDQTAALLDLARRSIAARLESRPLPSLESPAPRLLVPQGAFVSLHLRQALRGCVGLVMPRHPLVTTVTECAAAAATEDPRFDPLGSIDLDRIAIEISALDPPFRVEDPSRLVLGTHGLMVTMGPRRGLLLPQVAPQQGWGLSDFLEETCVKAGLPRDAWRRGAVVEAFSAQVFSERERATY